MNKRNWPLPPGRASQWRTEGPPSQWAGSRGSTSEKDDFIGRETPLRYPTEMHFFRDMGSIQESVWKWFFELIRKKVEIEFQCSIWKFSFFKETHTTAIPTLNYLLIRVNNSRLFRDHNQT
jgi:hypothetical protein